MLKKTNAEIKRRQIHLAPEERTQSSPEGMSGQYYTQKTYTLLFFVLLKLTAVFVK